jgi:hypothetical protein
MLKSYVGIVRDHSGSMAPHRGLAAKDYNLIIDGLRTAAKQNDIDTVVSVVKCGVGPSARVEREVTLSSVNALKSITGYTADGGGTPLWDSVGELIDIYKFVPDVNENEVTFLILVVTDGLENRSLTWSSVELRKAIVELQGTDRWSFAFRVPRGYSKELAYRLGVPLGNILEWEQTEAGFERAAASTTAAIASYQSGLRSGARSTTRFYVDMENIPTDTVKRELRDISRQVVIWSVPGPESVAIKVFCERKSGKPYVKGRAFYELIKTETVQDYKELVIRQVSSGAVYSGHAARDLLGLPIYGSMRLSPGEHGGYELFVQSTSLNRVLAPGSKLLYLVKP